MPFVLPPDLSSLLVLGFLHCGDDDADEGVMRWGGEVVKKVRFVWDG